MKVRFYKVAARELDDAVAYYERESAGLGKRFRAAVVNALERVKQFPEAYVPLSRRTRRCLVGKFPYGIIYRRTDSEIVIVAVAHLHRKPEYWISPGR